MSAWFAAPTWSYHQDGGTQLILGDAKAKALIDLSNAYGARVSRLALYGNKLGEGVLD